MRPRLSVIEWTCRRQKERPPRRSRSPRSKLRRRPVLALVLLLALLLAVPLLAPQVESLRRRVGCVHLAHHLLDGHDLTGRADEVTGGPGYPNLWFGPGFPLPFVALHLPLSVIRLLGPVLVFLATLLLFRLLRVYVSPRQAVARSRPGPNYSRVLRSTSG
jgi:hypothetical protein